MADSRYTQEADTKECGLIAGQQLINYTSDRGLVDRTHGIYWALQNSRFAGYTEEIKNSQFEIDSNDTRQMIAWLSERYGLPKQLAFPLKGRPIQGIIELLKQLKMDGLPQFQVLASGGHHAYAIHAMGPNNKLLTTGVPSGQNTYSPTQFYDQSIIIGSMPLNLPGYKPYVLDLKASYGFVTFDPGLLALMQDERYVKLFQKVYENLAPDIMQQLEKALAKDGPVHGPKKRL
ncbi:hypothetical protein GCM10027277_04870 [Pseudoduganella ginsengisoli]